MSRNSSEIVLHQKNASENLLDNLRLTSPHKLFFVAIEKIDNRERLTIFYYTQSSNRTHETTEISTSTISPLPNSGTVHSHVIAELKRLGVLPQAIKDRATINGFIFNHQAIFSEFENKSWNSPAKLGLFRHAKKLKPLKPLGQEKVTPGKGCCS